MKRPERRFLIALITLAVLVGVLSYQNGQGKMKLEFAEALDEVVAVVDGDEMTVRDVALYIAYEEGQVEKTARIYDEENTGAFWRVFSNHTFVRSKAKQTALDMAVHDEIFYQLSRMEGIELDGEEQQYLSDAQSDFLGDLEEGQKQALGVSEETLNESMRKIALAEKYQKLLAEINGKDYEDYFFDGEAYQELLKEHEYEIREKIWDRIDFGGITVDH